MCAPATCPTRARLRSRRWGLPPLLKLRALLLLLLAPLVLLPWAAGRRRRALPWLQGARARLLALALALLLLLLLLALPLLAPLRRPRARQAP